jgi:hypothetical protein
MRGEAAPPSLLFADANEQEVANPCRRATLCI